MDAYEIYMTKHLQTKVLREEPKTHGFFRREKYSPVKTYIEDMVPSEEMSQSPFPTKDIRIAFEAKIDWANGNYLMEINLSIPELLVIMGDRIGDFTLRELLESHEEGTAANPAATAAVADGVVQLTAEVHAELLERVEFLRGELVRNSVEIARAAADKDVRENALLDVARKYQGQLVSQIRVMEGTLAKAQIIDE